LVGIPAARRGVPQIEVTFDIDANGILHVSAKDLGTGKEQSIQITASSGLSKEEIERMVKEAESHAGEDKQKRELIEARNQADGLAYTTENSLKEHSEKLDSATKKLIEDALAALKTAMAADDVAEIKAKSEALAQASHKLAEMMYAQAKQEGDAGGEAAASEPADDNVVDAEFEDVDEKDKK
jgi:molecular chaperone DnaK